MANRIIDAGSRKLFRSLKENRQCADIYEILAQTHARLREFSTGNYTKRVDRILSPVMDAMRDIENGHFPFRQPISQKLRAALFSEFRRHRPQSCPYCEMTGDYYYGPDGKKWQVDHVVAVENGGQSYINNLKVCCWTCNSIKSDHPPEVFSAVLRDLQKPLHVFLSDDPNGREKITELIATYWLRHPERIPDHLLEDHA